MELAETIRKGILAVDIRHGDAAVSTSIGIGGLRLPATFDRHSAMTEVDRRLCRAKHAGGNRVVMGDAEDERAAA